jgi:glutathione S-transferase
MIRLHEFPASGNCYKVRLLFSHLGISFESVPVDLKGGEQKSPEFLARFPLGRVPIVELDNGEALAESNAILCYFSGGTPLLPADKLARARVMQWLFWEQYSHEPYIAVLRAWKKVFGVPQGREAEVPILEAKGKAALSTMNDWLSSRDFFEGGYSIADIALYAYTHAAEEGGFSLADYPNVTAWLSRVSRQRGFLPLK